MANLNYAELYEQTLFQAYISEMKFSQLWNTPTNQMIKFAGAKTVHIPHIDVSGAVNVNRDTIGAFGRNVDNSYELKTLSHDREFSTLVDPVDVDETNMALTIANITDVFNRFQKVPELDKYMISKIYSEAVRLGNTIDATVLTTANALQQFDDFMQAMDEGEVSDEGRILYVTPAIHNLIKNSDRLTRFQAVQNADGSVNRTVLSLDGVEVNVVAPNRMKSAYDFTTGAVDAVGAKQIQMALIHPSALLSPMKYEYVNVGEPSAQTKGKYLYYERFYCDVFALDRRGAGIQISAI
jgi:hypothetical protein